MSFVPSAVPILSAFVLIAAVQSLPYLNAFGNPHQFPNSSEGLSSTKSRTH